MAKNSIKIEKDGQTFEDPQEVAELFNDFFPEKVKHLKSKIKKKDDVDPLTKLREKVKDLNLHFELREIEEKDVMKILKKLKSKTSCGMDGISSEVLKMGASVLCAPVTLIINISIVDGKFPSQWKQSKCKPLFKKGNRKEMKNFRPVSLLSVPGMVLEKVIADQIEEFFESNKLFGSYQHGFRRKKGTVSELLELFESIMEAKDQRREIVLLVYDLSAAFDTVSHQTLIDKLTIYGFDTHAISWMESYLHERTQIVNVQEKNSSSTSMPFGTPQGSRISPLLFIIIMADLDLWTEGCDLSQFADDTQSLCVSDNKESVIEMTKREASNIIDFFSANDLVNNADKACVIYNAKGKGDQMTLENIGGEKLTSLDENQSEKLLGQRNRDMNFFTNSYCQAYNYQV